MRGTRYTVTAKCYAVLPPPPAVRLLTFPRRFTQNQYLLVGETRYVFGPDELRPIVFPRQALHAFRLEFVHPTTGKRLRFEAPMPKDLVDLVARLRSSEQKTDTTRRV